MIRVRILSPTDDVKRESVKTWWYEQSTLIVEYFDGETEQFPNGNVVERL